MVVEFGRDLSYHLISSLPAELETLADEGSDFRIVLCAFKSAWMQFHETEKRRIAMEVDIVSLENVKCKVVHRQQENMYIISFLPS